MANNEIKDPSSKLEEAKKIANKKKNTPSLIDSIEEACARFFRWLSSLIDRIFYSKKYVLLFSLLLALLLFFIVNISNSNIATNLSSSRTLTGVSVSARYNSESFELSGIPTTCDIVITGDAANVNNAVTKQGTCLINLEGYTEGTHTVPVETTGFGDYVTTVVVPSETQIVLKRKTTKEFTITTDFVNQNTIDSKYILNNPTFDDGKTTVNIRASQDTLNSIALVRALIDMSSYEPNLTKLDNNESDLFEIEVPLVAYNNKGQLVNADIYPNTVKALVEVTPAKGQSMMIQIQTEGIVPNGYALDSVILDHDAVVVYGEKTNDDKPIVKVDLSTIVAETNVLQPIILPNWVTKCEPATVNVQASLAPVVTKSFVVNIAYKNNDKGLAVLNVDRTSVTVFVTGTQKNIDKITSSDITAYVDVGGKEAGQYDLEIMTEVSDEFKIYITTEAEVNSLNMTLVEGK